MSLSLDYTFMLAELSVAGVKPDASRLDAIIGLAGELHEAFAQVARTSAESTSAVAAG